jgi:hypothetical protein
LGILFLWLIGCDWRKVPFNDHRRRSFKMAATAAILDLVSVEKYGNRLGRLVRFFCGLLAVTSDQRRRSFNMAATVAILDLISVDYRLCRLVRFFVANRGRFLSMTSAAAVMAAISELISVNFLTNASVVWLSSPLFKLRICLIKTSLIFNIQLGGIYHTLCCSCFTFTCIGLNLILATKCSSVLIMCQQ